MAKSKETSAAAIDADELLEKAKAEAEAIIAKAKDEAARIAAEAEKSASDTEPQEAPEEKPDPGDEMVPIRLFKDNGKYKDDVFVAVNGKHIQIKRGEQVNIKKKFADVLERSFAQDAKTAALIEEKSTEYQRESEKYGL